jgi:hypothetical protein
MKSVLAILLVLLMPALPICADDEAGHAKPPDLAAQKELVDEARNFLKSARASLARWDQVPDQLGKAVYYAGMRDGALGCCCCLIVLYLLTHRKTP